MSGKLRFLHASDLWLDVPINAIGQVPDHLRDRLIDAPTLALEQLVDVAVREEVDFLLLAGNVVNLSSCGPRVLTQILNAFHRLDKHGINVYWSSGQGDALAEWPSILQLPGNVHLFTKSSVESIYHYQGEEQVALILGAAAYRNDFSGEVELAQIDPAEFTTDDEETFTIGLCCGHLNPEEQTDERVTYWALGGQLKREAVSKQVPIAVYPGSTQSRGFENLGAHGANLITVDRDDQIQIRPVATDAVRFVNKRIDANELNHVEKLKNRMGEVALDLATKSAGQTLIVSWRIDCDTETFCELSTGTSLADLEKWLRAEFGQEQTGLWTDEVRVAHAGDIPTHWYEEDTILGDFLREFRQLAEDPSLSLDFQKFVPQTFRDRGGWVLEQLGEVEREKVLSEARTYGIDLLNG